MQVLHESQSNQSNSRTERRQEASKKNSLPKNLIFRPNSLFLQEILILGNFLVDRLLEVGY